MWRRRTCWPAAPASRKIMFRFVLDSLNSQQISIMKHLKHSGLKFVWQLPARWCFDLLRFGLQAFEKGGFHTASTTPPQPAFGLALAASGGTPVASLGSQQAVYGAPPYVPLVPPPHQSHSQILHHAGMPPPPQVTTLSSENGVAAFLPACQKV